MSLADKKCPPCDGGVPLLTRQQIEPLFAELKGWHLEDGDKRLVRSLKTNNFQESLDLANRIGAIAEEQGHHPDLLVRWGELRIDLWTHAIDGLTESDFVLAAKIDRVT
jgi:4a-hydroxytetrahydrobiopterin dehydratase